MPKLYQRNGTWWYSFTVAGKRCRKSAQTTDKELAKDIASKAEWRQRHAVVHGPESVLTFADALAMYMEQTSDHRFLLPLLDRWEKIKVKDISADEIRRAALDIYPSAANSTRNRQVITPARAVINNAADSGYCAHIRVKRFKENKVIRPAGNKEWLKTFKQSAVTPGLAAMAQFMFETGTRIGDSIALEWANVSLRDAIAIIRNPKNGEDHEAFLSPGMVAELANLDKSDRRVFGYHTRSVAHKHWNKSYLAAGLQKMTPHECGRHGFATEMIVRNGVDLPTTAKRGNWKSHRLMSERYVHPENERDVINNVFGERKKNRKR